MKTSTYISHKYTKYNVLSMASLYLLIFVFSCGCVQSHYQEDRLDFEIERHDSSDLPFKLSVFRDITTFQGSTFEEWTICIRNKDDGRGCYIHPVSSTEGIRKLIYLNPDTVRLIIDGPGEIYHEKSGRPSVDLSDAVKNDGIDVKILARKYIEDTDGIIKETIMPDISDRSTWRRNPVSTSEKRAILDTVLSSYMYLIAYDEKKDFIWIYDSNDSIVYRSPSLLKYHEEEPYLARRYEQKVM